MLLLCCMQHQLFDGRRKKKTSYPTRSTVLVVNPTKEIADVLAGTNQTKNRKYPAWFVLVLRSLLYLFDSEPQKPQRSTAAPTA